MGLKFMSLIFSSTVWSLRLIEMLTLTDLAHRSTMQGDNRFLV